MQKIKMNRPKPINRITSNSVEQLKVDGSIVEAYNNQQLHFANQNRSQAILNRLSHETSLKLMKNQESLQRATQTHSAQKAIKNKNYAKQREQLQRSLLTADLSTDDALKRLHGNQITNLTINQTILNQPEQVSIPISASQKSQSSVKLQRIQ